MSELTDAKIDDATIADEPPLTTTRTKTYIDHAKMIGALTLVSRILGMARESIASRSFGAVGWDVFTVAFSMPNLFRKLLGEGALSAAFIPLYGQSVKNDTKEEAYAFANASVNLLMVILIALTIIGELVLWIIGNWWPMPAEKLMAIKLTAIMLPYVMLVCGTAFLGSILQVHRRFLAITLSPILLNVTLIIAVVIAAVRLDLSQQADKELGVVWLSYAVLIAGVLQITALIPSLRAVGFRFQPVLHFWTPRIRKMLLMSLPVALGAGVLQISVLLDKALSWFLAREVGNPTFNLFGWVLDYPLELGAAARLNWAQYLYQFPLGIFAIAIATAIFPALSEDAGINDRSRFRSILRQGLESSLFIGLPASIGLALVSYPAVGLLFEGGEFTRSDTNLAALSTTFYAAGIWAFSLQQILSRAYYALHDTWTPLVLSIITLALNLIVELPLMWTSLGESGMAAGTTISFSVQAIVMLYMLNRRLGGIELRQSITPIGKMIFASAIMLGACLLVKLIPGYPAGDSKFDRLMQLIIVSGVGGVTYLGICATLGMNVMKHFRRKKKAKA